MRLQSCLALVCLVAAVAPAQATQSVVPGAYAAAPGTGVFLGPLANAARTYQLLIDSSQMTAHLGSALTGFSFRLPASATEAWPLGDLSFGSYDIRLSESVAPAARSLTFAQNVVGAQTLVRSGALTVPAGSFSSGSSPNAFGLYFDFDTDYQYNGGHLLIEIRHTGFSGTSRTTDALVTSTAGYGTLFSAAWGSGYEALSGSQGNFSVLQMTSVVPEPGSALLLAAGVAALLLRRRSAA